MESFDRVALLGQMDSFNNRPWLKNPEVVPEKWLGRLRPRYPGKTRVIGPETVRERVFLHLKEAIPVTAEFLAKGTVGVWRSEEAGRIGRISWVVAGEYYFPGSRSTEYPVWFASNKSHGAVGGNGYYQGGERQPGTANKGASFPPRRLEKAGGGDTLPSYR